MRLGLIGFVLGWVARGFWDRARGAGASTGGEAEGERGSADLAPAAAFARGPVQRAGEDGPTSPDAPR